MSEHSSEEVRSHIKFYWMIYVALMFLTVITLGATKLSVSIGLGIGIAMLIATVKGSLVAAHFMHLKTEKKIIFATLLITVLFFVVLMLLPTLTALDPLGGGIKNQ